MNGQFPIYIPSKGRADTRLTMRCLDRMGCDYTVIVEESQWEDYARVIDEEKLLLLDTRFQDEYETCDPEGDARGDRPGAGAARNFAWQHSIDRGYEWHWVMDDNIRQFFRLNHNRYYRMKTGTHFRAMEDFVLRFDNVAMAGPNYFMFGDRREKRHPFSLNTRIYSCNLIRNDVPFRWRGRMNEDTILSIDVLKAGWCTIQFYAFLQEKMVTQLIKGGYTDEFYAREGTRRKSQILINAHPDVAEHKHKFGRDHHTLHYGPWCENKLVRKPGWNVPAEVNEYDMEARAERTDV